MNFNGVKEYLEAVLPHEILHGGNIDYVTVARKNSADESIKAINELYYGSRIKTYKLFDMLRLATIIHEKYNEQLEKNIALSIENSKIKRQLSKSG